MKYQNITKFKDIFKEGYIAGNYVKASSQDEEYLDKNVILVPNLEYTKDVEDFIDEVYNIEDNIMQSRRLAREAIIGLIYELSFHDATEKPEDILADARAARGIPEDEYVDACFLGIADRLPELDEMIEKYSSGWRVDRISLVPRAILRLAVYELLFAEPRLPYSIAINEAVELAKAYAEDGAAPFVNGILNTVAKENGCEA